MKKPLTARQRRINALKKELAELLKPREFIYIECARRKPARKR